MKIIKFKHNERKAVRLDDVMTKIRVPRNPDWSVPSKLFSHGLGGSFQAPFKGATMDMTTSTASRAVIVTNDGVNQEELTFRPIIPGFEIEIALSLNDIEAMIRIYRGKD